MAGIEDEVITLVSPRSGYAEAQAGGFSQKLRLRDFSVPSVAPEADGLNIESWFRHLATFAISFLIFSLHDDKRAAGLATPEFPFLDFKERCEAEMKTRPCLAAKSRDHSRNTFSHFDSSLL